MRTDHHTKPGKFPLEKGTCIIKPDLPMADGTRIPGPNYHPFIVIGEGKTRNGTEYVELLMGRTLFNSRDGKDRSSKLERFPSAVEIERPCPPMDRPDRRRQYTDAAQVMIVPKTVLYEATDVEICSVYGNKLDREQAQALADEAKKHASSRYACRVDPYKCNENYYPPFESEKHRNIPSSFEEIAAKDQNAIDDPARRGRGLGD